MEFNAVLFDSHDKKSVRSFLRFPSTLYQKQNLMQDTATEAAVLSGKHLLSHYFTVYPFLAYDSAHNVAAQLRGRLFQHELDRGEDRVAGRLQGFVHFGS